MITVGQTASAPTPDVIRFATARLAEQARPHDPAKDLARHCRPDAERGRGAFETDKGMGLVSWFQGQQPAAAVTRGQGEKKVGVVRRKELAGAVYKKFLRHWKGLVVEMPIGDDGARRHRR